MCTSVLACSDSEVDSVLESNLASGAARAAIELDQLLIGHPTSLCSTTAVTEFLTSSIPAGSGSTPPAWIDYSTVVVLGQALEELQRCPKPVTVQDLVSEAVEVVGGVSEIRANVASEEAPHEEQVRTLRDFFLALSRAAVSAEEPIMSSRFPSHPFRA